MEVPKPQKAADSMTNAPIGHVAFPTQSERGFVSPQQIIVVFRLVLLMLADVDGFGSNKLW